MYFAYDIVAYCIFKWKLIMSYMQMQAELGE